MTYQEILFIIAQRNGTTPERVEAAMKEAITSAYTTSDPEIKKAQELIKCRGDMPTPEELITQVAKIVFAKSVL